MSTSKAVRTPYGNSPPKHPGRALPRWTPLGDYGGPPGTATPGCWRISKAVVIYPLDLEAL